jgi:hypothetical protein
MLDSAAHVLEQGNILPVPRLVLYNALVAFSSRALKVVAEADSLTTDGMWVFHD